MPPEKFWTCLTHRGAEVAATPVVGGAATPTAAATDTAATNRREPFMGCPFRWTCGDQPALAPAQLGSLILRKPPGPRPHAPGVHDVLRRSVAISAPLRRGGSDRSQHQREERQPGSVRPPQRWRRRATFRDG